MLQKQKKNLLDKTKVLTKQKSCLIKAKKNVNFSYD